MNALHRALVVARLVRDPTFVPRSVVRRLEARTGSGVIVKGWFTRGRLPQVEPWGLVSVELDGEHAGVVSQGGPRKSVLWVPVLPGRHELRFVGVGDYEENWDVELRRVTVRIASASEVQYLAFVPPRQNPFAGRRRRKAKSWAHLRLRE